MAFHPECNITIDGKYLQKFAHSIKINSSNKILADTCEIELPTSTMMLYSDKKQIISFSKIIETGMQIVVELGYNGNLKEEFVGYISEIHPQQTKFVIKCEDEAYNLRRLPIKAHEYTGTVKGWLAKYAPGVKLSKYTNDVAITKFTLTGESTVGKELIRLADYYLLTAYYRGENLYVGLPYLDNTDMPVLEFGMTKNILAGSDQLQWTQKKDLNICVKVVSIVKNNKRIVETDGDETGNMITILRRGIEDKAELKRIAKAEREKFSYDGFRGSFKILGHKEIFHSQIAHITDNRYAERNGKYLIDSYKISFDGNGYRKEIHLGRAN